MTESTRKNKRVCLYRIY